MWMISFLLNIIFPTRCIGCGRNNASLCARCLTLARKSISSPHPYNTSLFDFKDPLIKRAIHAIKYYHRRDLIAPLVLPLSKQIESLPGLNQLTLIPIPMPPWRKLIRGYNHAELIAHEIATLLSLPVSSTILTRSRGTKRQAITLTRKERIQNQKGAFALRGNVSGGRFLIIDDVLTTGATLDEARKLLLQHGATQVLTATIAH